MSDDSIIPLITAGLAFIASVIAVVVSAYNARFSRFASERWWERKAEAYVQIINALSDLVFYYEQTYNAEFEGRELSDARKEEINRDWQRGFLQVKKASNIGAFMISKKAEDALKQYWGEPTERHDPGDWFWHLEYNYSKADECLKQMVICAKADLQVEKKWGPYK